MKIDINATVKVQIMGGTHNITLIYKTFIKAPFDAYLIAALIKNTKGSRSEKKDINDYIDDISGDGSLNSYFKGLYKTLSEFSDEQIDDIVEHNNYPVKVVDESNEYIYYPSLNISRLGKKFYEGDIGDDAELIKRILVEEIEGVKVFEGMEVNSTEDAEMENEIFQAHVTSSGTEIAIPGLLQPISITNEKLSEICGSTNLSREVSDFEGEFSSEASGDNWYLLTADILKSYVADKNSFYGPDDELYIISPDKIEYVNMVQVTTKLYFSRREERLIVPENGDLCNLAIIHLIDSGRINEFRTEDLLKLLNCVDKENAVKALSSILSVKNSNALASYAIQLLKEGYTSFSADACRKMKAAASPMEMKYVYQANPHIEYSVSDFLQIPDELLLPEHLNKKIKYRDDLNFCINEINRMLGEMASSSVRESLKTLSSNNKTISNLRKFLNKYLGHNQIDFTSITDLNILDEHYTKIKNVYNNEYVAVRKMLTQEKGD